MGPGINSTFGEIPLNDSLYCVENGRDELRCGTRLNKREGATTSPYLNIEKHSRDCHGISFDEAPGRLREFARPTPAAAFVARPASVRGERAPDLRLASHHPDHPRPISRQGRHKLNDGTPPDGSSGSSSPRLTLTVPRESDDQGRRMFK